MFNSGNKKLLQFYPVGSVYQTTNASFNPNNSWGGTWVLMKDTFLVGAGNLYAVGATGGEVTHTLTVNEMPSHNNNINDDISVRNVALDTSKGMASSVWAINVSNGTSTKFNQGGGLAHNNMPPYQAVNIWCRTA